MVHLEKKKKKKERNSSSISIIESHTAYVKSASAKSSINERTNKTIAAPHKKEEEKRMKCKQQADM